MGAMKACGAEGGEGTGAEEGGRMHDTGKTPEDTSITPTNEL
jgi:hypothetical protein